MRNYILTLVFLAFHLFSISGTTTISEELASRIACNFYVERASLSKVHSINSIKVKAIRSGGISNSEYFICEMHPKGFVIVSASENVLPVLAYSFESEFAEKDQLQEGIEVWLDFYAQQIKYAIENNLQPSADITKTWEHLKAENFLINSKISSLQTVEPLLTSKWNQDYPYNSLCPAEPAGPGGHCYAGCVATAMGQLLNYYRFPQQGQGSYTYTHPVYGTLSANFDSTYYHWDEMTSTIAKPENAIGELLLHQGVSVDMDYGPDGSGMWNHKAAFSLKNYFRYGPETQYYFRDSVTIDWDSLLITNLNQRKPLYYAGWAGVQSTSGHAFVCDGYQPGNYYHFNWGWGGSQDGYFYTDNLTPGGNIFNFAQEVIPMFPDTIQNVYPTFCQGNSIRSQLRGSIEDGSGWYAYQNNSSCSWLISPEDATYDSIKNIKIDFLKFNTESDADILYVYDGPDSSFPLLGSYSGNTLPASITSTNNKVFIEFHTNATIVKDGWLIEYESKFPVYCTGITTLTESSGSISDGSANKNYNNNVMCRWKIVPAESLPLTFTFNEFEMADTNDFVKIYDLESQEILGVFSGNQLPPAVTSNSGKMLILFITNSSGNAQGFSGVYNTSGVGLNEPDSCYSHAQVYPNPTTGSITVEKYLPSGTKRVLQFHLIDINGMEVYAKNVVGVSGFNKFLLDLPETKVSAYFLIIEDGEQKETIRILKVSE